MRMAPSLSDYDFGSEIPKDPGPFICTACKKLVEFDDPRELPPERSWMCAPCAEVSWLKHMKEDGVVCRLCNRPAAKHPNRMVIQCRNCGIVSVAPQDIAWWLSRVPDLLDFPLMPNNDTDWKTVLKAYADWLVFHEHPCGKQLELWLSGVSQGLVEDVVWP